MPSVDRMFRVIVAGGVALTAAGSGVIAGCGGSDTTLATGDGGKGSDGSGSDGFPHEGADTGAQDGFPSEGFPAPDAFPSETAQQVDSGIHDSGKDADAFPQEGPPPLEGGLSDGFPSEAA
jgi:hypothetical protein